MASMTHPICSMVNVNGRRWSGVSPFAAATSASRSRLFFSRAFSSHAFWSSRVAIRVIDRMYTLLGGTSVFETSCLQQHFRDVHVASQHMMVAEPVMELAGRVMVGLDDKGISTLDTSGVALAAIQGLHLEIAELRDEIARLRRLVDAEDESREEGAEHEAPHSR